MPSVIKQTWSDCVSVIAVWAAGIFLLMFFHQTVGIQSEWMPGVVFGSFAAILVLAPIGSLLWRRLARAA